MPYYGKYRGSVVDNLDPLEIGRVLVAVPAAFASGESAWAMPCAPLAGDGVGFFAVPEIGANVWVEFEAGDVNYPIYVGGFWNVGEVPGNGLPSTTIVKTTSASIVIDDRPALGGLTIQIGPPAVPTALHLSMTASGIEISAGGTSLVIDDTSVSVDGVVLGTP